MSCLHRRLLDIRWNRNDIWPVQLWANRPHPITSSRQQPDHFTDNAYINVNRQGVMGSTISFDFVASPAHSQQSSLFVITVSVTNSNTANLLDHWQSLRSSKLWIISDFDSRRNGNPGYRSERRPYCIVTSAINGTFLQTASSAPRNIEATVWLANFQQPLDNLMMLRLQAITRSFRLWYLGRLSAAG